VNTLHYVGSILVFASYILGHTLHSIRDLAKGVYYYSERVERWPPQDRAPEHESFYTILYKKWAES